MMSNSKSIIHIVLVDYQVVANRFGLHTPAKVLKFKHLWREMNWQKNPVSKKKATLFIGGTQRKSLVAIVVFFASALKSFVILTYLNCFKSKCLIIFQRGNWMGNGADDRHRPKSRIERASLPARTDRNGEINMFLCWILTPTKL